MVLMRAYSHSVKSFFALGDDFPVIFARRVGNKTWMFSRLELGRWRYHCRLEATVMCGNRVLVDDRLGRRLQISARRGDLGWLQLFASKKLL